MTKKRLTKIVFLIFLIMTALILMPSIFCAKKSLDKKTNHEKVMKIINDSHSSTAEYIIDESQKIDNMISTGSYYDADLGLLYEHAGSLYKELGEEMTYYRYLGYALYYLEQSEEKDYTVNLYLNLANLHINNHSYADAEEMFNRASDVEKIEDITNPKIKSYAYRVLALYESETNNCKQAASYLVKSQECLKDVEKDFSTDTDILSNKILLAKIYQRQGNFDKSNEILEECKSSVPERTNDPTLLRDVVIPYYQTKCLLIVNDKNITQEEAMTEIDNLLDACKEHGYEKVALDTLIAISKELPSYDVSDIRTIEKDIAELSDSIISYQDKTYSSIINSQVTDSSLSMAKSVEFTKNTQKRTMLTILAIVITILIILFFIIIILSTRRDGLTFLYNRRTFNFDIERIKRSTIPYSVIMMDIDNFKTINDTYGHPEGDKVLQKLGQFINNETNSDIKGYRYGGEEFAIILSKNSYTKTMEVAENLRRNMEASRWPFDPDLVITISLGVASGSSVTDVVKKADENLYFSKHNGKNQICTD